MAKPTGFACIFSTFEARCLGDRFFQGLSLFSEKGFDSDFFQDPKTHCYRVGNLSAPSRTDWTLARPSRFQLAPICERKSLPFGAIIHWFFDMAIIRPFF